jgi:hypothetical protein
MTTTNTTMKIDRAAMPATRKPDDAAGRGPDDAGSDLGAAWSAGMPILPPSGLRNPVARLGYVTWLRDLADVADDSAQTQHVHATRPAAAAAGSRGIAMPLCSNALP